MAASGTPPDVGYEIGPVRAVFGAGALGHLGDELDRLDAGSALVVTTQGRAATAPALLAAVGPRVAGVFDGARVHVPQEVVGRALEAAARAAADALVAYGGGSAIGVAKAVALETGAPIVAIPTTYSGSEMTAVWGITGREGKRTGRDAWVRPRVVLYDPLLTLDLPPALSVRSGINALAHCVEALYAHDGHPFASLLAEEGIRALAGALPRVRAEPRDPGARGHALYGAHLAGWALDTTSMGLQHKLAHVLGGAFDLPHAALHAVLLPHVVAFNAPSAPEAMTRVARALGSAGSDEVPTALFDLNRALGIHETLRDLGLRPPDLERAAHLAAENRYPNPRPPAREEVRAILDAAWRGHRPASPAAEGGLS